jgi:hypothetical protein
MHNRLSQYLLSFASPICITLLTQCDGLSGCVTLLDGLRRGRGVGRGRDSIRTGIATEDEEGRSWEWWVGAVWLPSWSLSEGASESEEERSENAACCSSESFASSILFAPCSSSTTPVS